MQTFVSEGRIISTSLITTDPNVGYYQASDYPIFTEWQFVARQAVRTPQPDRDPSAHQMQSSQQVQATVSAPLTRPDTAPAPQASVAVTGYDTALTYNTPEPSVFTIMAEIRSGQDLIFLQRLQSLGPAQRVGDTVWILRTNADAESLKNALSQNLTKQDRLFIVDSAKNQTAWYNIGADMDIRIRNIWQS